MVNRGPHAAGGQRGGVPCAFVGLCALVLVGSIGSDLGAKMVEQRIISSLRKALGAHPGGTDRGAGALQHSSADLGPDPAGEGNTGGYRHHPREQLCGESALRCTTRWLSFGRLRERSRPNDFFDPIARDIGDLGVDRDHTQTMREGFQPRICLQVFRNLARALEHAAGGARVRSREIHRSPFEAGTAMAELPI